MAKRWHLYAEEKLLDQRICDLKLRLSGSAFAPRLERLNAELAAAGLRFRPHYWLSQEWFTPDGVPGIAIPFFLAHPRLAQLERKFMVEAEGHAEAVGMRILRHEAGHAIDNAYRLHRRKRWREMFGSFREPYPETYRPRPADRNYVQHLNGWYAQAHPAEDFAETFAVWLTPGLAWRSRFKGWPALQKLEYVDGLMAEIGTEKPKVRTRRQIEPLSQATITLREFYDRKREHYAVDWPGHYDSELRRVFEPCLHANRRPAAAVWLRHHRRELSRTVGEAAGVPAYTIDQLLVTMIERCRDLKLRLRLPARATREKVLLMLTVTTMQATHGRYFPIAL
jgi:hypothetical protein